MKESGRQLSDGPWPGLGQAPLKQQQPVFPEARPSHTVFAKALLWSVCPPPPHDHTAAGGRSLVMLWGKPEHKAPEHMRG